MRDDGLERAIEAAGGISALARAVGIAQPSVSNWTKVPAERVLAVEAVTAVPRWNLRPDLYPEPQEAADIDDVDRARGGLYLLLANVLREPPTQLMLMDLAGGGASGGGGDIAEALDAVAAAARGADADDVRREHFNLFVGVGRAELLPYASYYRTGFLYERPLVNVREDMRVLGIQRAGEDNEPEDAIAFLCEAMAGMALGRFDAAPEFQRRFFMRHLATWAERFFADLEATEAARFYRPIGTLGRILIALEREAYGLERDEQSGAGRERQDGGSHG